MTDHDQRFKEMLREFVWELQALFLPWLLERLAERKADWQSQELFTNPPFGLVKRLDLLAILNEQLDQDKTRDRLLHLEVDSATSLTEVRKKIGYYYPNLRTKHILPITCLAIYLRVGLEGTGWDEYVERDEHDLEQVLFRVKWRYVGLPALPAQRYLESDNWLGVALASLMKIEEQRKPWLRAECLRRLLTECRENDYRRLLLINCVETYLPLEGPQESEFLRLLEQDSRYQETNAMLLSAHDRIRVDGERKGEEKGELKGELKGERKALHGMVIRLGSKRCGPPEEAIRTQITAIEDIGRLERMVDATTTAQSWQELLAVS